MHTYRMGIFLLDIFSLKTCIFSLCDMALNFDLEYWNIALFYLFYFWFTFTLLIIQVDIICSWERERERERESCKVWQGILLHEVVDKTKWKL
jgi:hypothetical protein